MNLLATLIEKNIIDKNEASSIKEEVESSGESLEAVLARHGVDVDIILSSKSEGMNIPTKRIGDEKIPFDVLSYIPEESAQHYKFVPLGVRDGVLEVGIIDPDNIEALDALNFISTKISLPFKVFLISETDFDRVIKMYKGLSGEVGKALSELESELETEAVESPKPVEEKISGPEVEQTDEQIIKEDAPVTKMVATMLRYAVEGGASDVHIEHTGENVRIRFRVDGVLTTSLILPAKVHRAMVARIKILSSMKLDEHRKPQDGRFSAKVVGRRIDFRVSTFPSYFGEKVVMRILDAERGVWKLEEMGLSDHDMQIIRSAIKRPYGLILISGPTGSGKSTTLYSMLNELDRETKNVLSLEDPVEYNIEGVSQSQVHPEIGYTFATGLRTTLRQDPDIIMVGEIRDKETAQLAVQAALTGHLVLSTIHTNSAVGVIPRLIDMGVDPYLIAPTLIVAVAQRLVRTLCPGTGKKVPIEGSVRIMLEKQFEDLPRQYFNRIPKGDYLYAIESTPDCPNGTRGRTAVFEIMVMNKEIEQTILKDPVESEIYRIARSNGMFTMKEDAIIKALKQMVPFEEINTLGSDIFADEDVGANDEPNQKT